MAADPISANSHPVYEGTYLDVVRLDDGRYCVRFVKHGAPPVRATPQTQMPL